jgi:carotenoid cleavage dioxygenase-like enzyme
VPRGAEGEGFAVSVGQNIAQSVTELYLLDARTMEELARVTLPFRTSPQIHGTWGDPDHTAAAVARLQNAGNLA